MLLTCQPWCGVEDSVCRKRLHGGCLRSLCQAAAEGAGHGRRQLPADCRTPHIQRVLQGVQQGRDLQRRNLAVLLVGFAVTGAMEGDLRDDASNSAQSV